MENFDKNIQRVIEDDSLKKYDLKFAGIGAESICFETKDSDKKLIKINISSLREKVLSLLAGNKETGQASHLEQKESIDKIREQEKIIESIFGSGHLLKKGVFRAKIPLSKFIILNILADEDKHLVDDLEEERTYEVEMLVQTQIIAKELKDPEQYKTEDFSTELLTQNDFENSKDTSEALSKIESLVDEHFINSITKNISDEKHSKITKEITEGIIKYCKETGLILDIFGPNNITIFENENGEYDFHLIDVVMPGHTEQWNQSLNDDKNFEVLRHYYTFWYSINKLAEIIGIKDNLEIEDLVYFKDASIPFKDFPKK